MFIITGMGRGGTSLVTCMLRENPKIDMLFENSDVCRTPKEPWQKREIRDSMEGIILADKILCGSLFLHEKYPERLIKWYHDTKFLFIYRDGRDMMAGLQQICSNSVCSMVKNWNDYINISQAFMKKHPYRCYSIKYTDFILRTKHNLISLCNFIDIPYTEKMFDFTMEVEEYRKKYGNKIDTSRIHLWKKLQEKFNQGTYKHIDLLLKAEECMKKNLVNLGFIK